MPCMLATTERQLRTRKVPLTFIPYYAWSNRAADCNAGVDTDAESLIPRAIRSLQRIVDGISRTGTTESRTTALLRWRIAILVSVAIAISYLDRQTLPVAVTRSQEIFRFPISDSQRCNRRSCFPMR